MYRAHDPSMVKQLKAKRGDQVLYCLYIYNTMDILGGRPGTIYYNDT